MLLRSHRPPPNRPTLQNPTITNYRSPEPHNPHHSPQCQCPRVALRPHRLLPNCRTPRKSRNLLHLGGRCPSGLSTSNTPPRRLIAAAAGWSHHIPDLVPTAIAGPYSTYLPLVSSLPWHDSDAVDWVANFRLAVKTVIFEYCAQPTQFL